MIHQLHEQSWRASNSSREEDKKASGFEHSKTNEQSLKNNYSQYHQLPSFFLGTIENSSLINVSITSVYC